MNLSRPLCVTLLVLLIVTVGCGGGSSFDPNNVTVAISPSAATIPTSGQVALQAIVKGSPAAPSTPPAGPCPDGTIQGVDAGSLKVTYLAPSTTGTFHVIAQDNVSLTLVKDATAVVTVSP